MASRLWEWFLSCSRDSKVVSWRMRAQIVLNRQGLTM